MRSALAGLLCFLLWPAALAQTPAEDEAAIREQARRFSEAYMAGDIETLVSIYTQDGIAGPGGRDFVVGRAALTELWTLPEGRIVSAHRSEPIRIELAGDIAIDHGYYSGAAGPEGGEQTSFEGKYLIIWRRDGDGVWRMAHDMWNRLPAED